MPSGGTDEALVGAIHAEHGRALARYATRLLGDDHGGADAVVEETLVRALRDPTELAAGRGPTRGLLLSIARGCVVERLRGSPEPRPAGGPAAVLRALDAISAEHRRVLDLLYLQGRTVDELAAPGVPHAVVRARAVEALRALRSALGGPPGEPPHDPVALGAHALGLHDVEESRAVEVHLAGCPSCRREWEQLRHTAARLGGVVPENSVDGPPPGELPLRRALRRIRDQGVRDRRRRRITAATAAAVVIGVALGSGAVLGRRTAPDAGAAVAAGPSAGSVVFAGTGVAGTVLSATVTPAAGWVRLSVTVRGVPAGERCRLIVLSRTGGRELAGSWVAADTGGATGTSLDGSAAVAPADVEA
ncbi:MAG: hypothetical protein L0I24_06170, partial [Pseudonocardia sp.]|nr:hypothetical protein [Pseudonocardia sp.]